MRHEQEEKRRAIAMSHHEFFLNGVKRHVIVVDPEDAIHKLAMWTHCWSDDANGSVDPTDLSIHWDIDRPIDLVAREIVMLLETISDGSVCYRCAVCAKRFSLGRLPLRFICVWPVLDQDDITDADTLGLCSTCSVRPTLLWDDALDVFERCRIERKLRIQQVIEILTKVYGLKKDEP